MIAPVTKRLPLGLRALAFAPLSAVQMVIRVRQPKHMVKLANLLPNWLNLQAPADVPHLVQRTLHHRERRQGKEYAMKCKYGNRQRSIYASSGKRLRKLKRRYISKVKPYIDVDRSLLWPIAEKMSKRGIYSRNTCLEHVRFSILRVLFKLDGCRDANNDWWRWLIKKGWGQDGWRYAA